MGNSKIKTILIGTTNETKFRMYRDILSFTERYGVKIEKISNEIKRANLIQESFDNLEKNAIAKATAYARYTGHFTIADDTGFYIPSLNNEPGPAVRRWGGKLPEDISDKEWVKYFLNRLQEVNIKTPFCVKRHVVAFCCPDGECQTDELNLTGKIKIPGTGNYVDGGPLSSYFFIDQCHRFESELTEKEKNIIYGDFKLKIADMLFNAKFLV